MFVRSNLRLGRVFSRNILHRSLSGSASVEIQRNHEISRSLLKPDLHTHIDGCVRPSTVWELAAEQKVSLPDVSSLEELADIMTNKEDCPDLVTFLKPYDLVGRYD